jgi:hypothetical protein
MNGSRVDTLSKQVDIPTFARWWHSEHGGLTMQTDPGRLRRPQARAWLTPLLVGVVVASTLVIGFGPPGLLLPKTCQLGKDIGTYLVWTPLTLVNIPDGGGVSVSQNSWNYTMTSGSVTLTSPPANTGLTGEQSSPPSSGIFNTFEETNWTFYETQNVSPSGSTAVPCTQPYIAEFTGAYDDCFASPTLPLQNNTSDAIEPHSSNWSGFSPECPAPSPGAYVWFNTSFPLPATGASTRLNLCGQSGFDTLAAYTPVQLPIAVNVPFQGREISSVGHLSWQGVDSAADEPSVTYNVPADWMWEVAPIGPTHSPLNLSRTLTQLLAFERFPC